MDKELYIGVDVSKQTLSTLLIMTEKALIGRKPI